MSQVTVSDLREYLQEENPRFDEDTSLEDIHPDWFTQALDTVFGQKDGLDMDELAEQWETEASDEYVTKSAFIATLFRERVSEEVIQMMSESERDLFVKIHVEVLEETISS